jgi:hypothetical protein
MPFPELHDDSNFNYYILMKIHMCFITNLFLYCVYIFGKWDVGGMDWIDLAQDRDMWQELMYVVMNLWVPQNAGNFLIS